MKKYHKIKTVYKTFPIWKGKLSDYIKITKKCLACTSIVKKGSFCSFCLVTKNSQGKTFEEVYRGKEMELYLKQKKKRLK